MKRVFWQCDKCSKSVEAESAPTSWVNARVEWSQNHYPIDRLWCDDCWSAIRAPHVKDAAA